MNDSSLRVAFVKEYELGRVYKYNLSIATKFYFKILTRREDAKVVLRGCHKFTVFTHSVAPLPDAYTKV